jgi:hypothetical protein
VRAFIIALLSAGVCYAEEEISIDHIVAAVCQIESGTVWKGPGVVSGRFNTGGSGEIGPWQAMPYTIRDMGRSVRRNHGSVRYAETTFRIWYARLLHKHGSHPEALAAYHKGSAGIYKASAKNYAERAMNLAKRLAEEAGQ